MSISAPIKTTSTEVTYTDHSLGKISPSSFTVRREYTNYSKNDIYLQTQSNLPVVVVPCTHFLSPNATAHLEVRSTYILASHDAFVKTRELLEAFEHNGGILAPDARFMLRQMTERIKNNNRISTHVNFTVVTFQAIDVQELVADEVVYIRESDVVISLRKDSVLQPHPNSSTGFSQTAIKQNEELQGHSGVFVKIIDNLRETRSWFYYSGKKVIEVPARQDERNGNGVYVTVSSMVGGQYRTQTERLSFEEAQEKIGLYKTKDEAISAGDPESIRALRIQQLHVDELEAKIRELEAKESLVVRKTDSELKTMEEGLKNKKETAKLDKEDDYEARKQKRRLAKFEKNSNILKITGDVIKGIVVIAAGIFGAITLFGKRSAA